MLAVVFFVSVCNVCLCSFSLFLGRPFHVAGVLGVLGCPDRYHLFDMFFSVVFEALLCLLSFHVVGVLGCLCFLVG